MNMHPSLADLPPYQFNYNHKGLTLHWNGTDQPELYEKHMQNPSTRNLLKQLGWIDSIIEYSYNSHGFRCDEFDDRPAGLALGCSFTEGTGLHLQQTWPALLSTMSNTHIWNLGSGGSSIDTVFRTLDHYINRLNVKFVCILIPPEPRFEYCDIQNGFPIIQSGNLGQHTSFAKEWLTQPFNGIYNTRKTMLAIYYLCETLGIPVFSEPSTDAVIGNTKFGQTDFARDLMHRGILYQKYIAGLMHQKVDIFLNHDNE
jgi:hypothetical protein